MSNFFVIGVAIYMIGHGLRGVAGMSIVGSAAMIVGGILVLVGAI